MLCDSARTKAERHEHAAPKLAGIAATARPAGAQQRIDAGAARTASALLVDWFANLMPASAVRALQGMLARDGTAEAGNALALGDQCCARLRGPFLTIWSAYVR